MFTVWGMHVVSQGKIPINSHLAVRYSPISVTCSEISAVLGNFKVNFLPSGAIELSN